MMGNLGIVIELMVVGLLMVTIGYCIVLDRRLRAVRQDEQIMRKTVLELGVATERAERAIDSLRHTLGDCDRTLGERLRVAERYTADLEDQIRSGDDILNRISRIVSTTGEQAMEAAAPPPRSGLSRINQTLAAAQALASQAQTRVNEQSQREQMARDHVA
jgi:predicted nucleic acid-binding protein